MTWPRFEFRGVWGAEPLAQSLWLKAKEIVRANGEPPIVNQPRAARVPHARSERGNPRAWFQVASAQIPGPGFGLSKIRVNRGGERAVEEGFLAVGGFLIPIGEFDQELEIIVHVVPNAGYVEEFGNG